MVCAGGAQGRVPEMATQSAQFEPVAWWSTRNRIGEDLRERYEVPKELPGKLLTLVKKLDERPRPLWSSSRRELHNRPPRSSKSWLAELAAEWDAMLNARRQDHPEDRAQD
jgi:hypothetical protein